MFWVFPWLFREFARQRCWGQRCWQELGPALRVVFRPHPLAVAGKLDGTESDTVSDTVNGTVNERQRWFLAQLYRGNRVTWREIAQHFQVSQSTAKRDIAGLQAKGLVEFVGAPKTGSYRLREQP